MNEIVNKFLFAGDKCMSKMHLRQPGFTYSACGPFIENEERIQQFKETGDSWYLHQNELDKDLTKRTTSDKILRDKAFKIAKIQNMMDIKGVSLQKKIFLIKGLLVLVLKMRICQTKNYKKQLLENFLKKEKYTHLL